MTREDALIVAYAVPAGATATVTGLLAAAVLPVPGLTLAEAWGGYTLVVAAVLGFLAAPALWHVRKLGLPAVFKERGRTLNSRDANSRMPYNRRPASGTLARTACTPALKDNDDLTPPGGGSD